MFKTSHIRHVLIINLKHVYDISFFLLIKQIFSYNKNTEKSMFSFFYQNNISFDLDKLRLKKMCSFFFFINFFINIFFLWSFLMMKRYKFK